MKKILIFISVLLLFSIFMLYKKSCVKIWRRRFSEFPVYVFDMACGNEFISTENGLESTTITKCLDQNLSSVLRFNDDNVTKNNIVSFINSWRKSLSIPNIMDKKCDSILYINSNQKLKLYKDSYFLNLVGRSRGIIDGTEYIFLPGDIVFISKNKEYEFINISDKSLMMSILTD